MQPLDKSRTISLIRKVFEYLNIESEVEDFESIHQTIEKDIIFKGTNLWILVFAILVASVGLNMNSTAVIIGAMLISPLMGPINGIGYSVATYNFALFRKAIKNFSFAVGASLIASTVYFALSPVSTAHSELLARTSPTIYDVLIALFGGLAGIVAISSKQKGNVIPGVAIATALMPPLCTAGYGLATGQFNYFFGAFYLFTINTVFIALSALVISQMLKFPIRTIIENTQRKKINQGITLVIFITIVPSIYFGYGLVQKERFVENANKYTQSISVFEGSYLLRSDINPDRRTISLVYGGNSLQEEQKAGIRARAEIFNLTKTSIEIQQGFALDESVGNYKEIDRLKSEINRLNLQLAEMNCTQDSIENRMVIGKQLLKEIKPLYPQVTGAAYGETIFFSDSTVGGRLVPLVIFHQESSQVILPADKARINSWLRSRLSSEDVKSYFEIE
jgi:uncharacterized hydrophobic protein (TIGR00271 family)